MRIVPFTAQDPRPDRSSDAPFELDVEVSSASRRAKADAGWARRAKHSWRGMSGYLVAGVFLGLVLIVGLSFMREEPRKTAAGVVTDNVVHLNAKDIQDACWRGTDANEPARVTVALEIGVDGKVRRAVAAGESLSMRRCVETHVKTWEFLPQAAAAQVVLPVEIASR